MRTPKVSGPLAWVNPQPLLHSQNTTFTPTKPASLPEPPAKAPALPPALPELPLPRYSKLPREQRLQVAATLDALERVHPEDIEAKVWPYVPRELHGHPDVVKLLAFCGLWYLIPEEALTPSLARDWVERDLSAYLDLPKRLQTDHVVLSAGNFPKAEVVRERAKRGDLPLLRVSDDVIGMLTKEPLLLAVADSRIRRSWEVATQLLPQTAFSARRYFTVPVMSDKAFVEKIMCVNPVIIYGDASEELKFDADVVAQALKASYFNPITMMSPAAIAQNKDLVAAWFVRNEPLNLHTFAPELERDLDFVLDALHQPTRASKELLDLRQSDSTAYEALRRRMLDAGIFSVHLFARMDEISEIIAHQNEPPAGGEAVIFFGPHQVNSLKAHRAAGQRVLYTEDPNRARQLFTQHKGQATKIVLTRDPDRADLQVIADAIKPGGTIVLVAGSRQYDALRLLAPHASVN